MTDEPDEVAPHMLNCFVGVDGVQILFDGRPTTHPFGSDVSRALGQRMIEAADLWEKTYRAFVHDETDTVH